MKISSILLSGASAILLLFSQPARSVAQESSTTMSITANFDPKIAGDSTTTGHAGEISVVSFKFGIEQKGGGATASGLGAGKAEFQPMTIYKYLDKASARLFVECAKGSHFKTMTLSVSESNIETPQVVNTLLTIQLANVLIKSINTDSSTVDNRGNLVESVTLQYTSAFWTFRDSDGQTYTGGWDLKGNREIKPTAPVGGL